MRGHEHPVPVPCSRRGDTLGQILEGWGTHSVLPLRYCFITAVLIVDSEFMDPLFFWAITRIPRSRASASKAPRERWCHPQWAHIERCW